MRSKQFFWALLLIQLFSGFSEADTQAKAEKQGNKISKLFSGGKNSPKNDKQDEKGDVITAQNLLSQAVDIFEKINDGSSAAFNRIGSAHFTLAEGYEKKDQKDEANATYLKALESFHKASKSGCKEAEYNAGIVSAKLDKYKEAAEHYKKCILECDNTKDYELALKAAFNLSLLFLDKNVEYNAEDVKIVFDLSKKYDCPKSKELTQITVSILTNILAQENDDKKNAGDSTKEQKAAGVLNTEPTDNQAENHTIPSP